MMIDGTAFEDMDQAALSASELLKALASPNRLKILCHLVEGEKSVGQIAARVGLREATVSQHLALLRRDRLVRTRRAAQTVFYSLDSPAAARILRVLSELYCPAATQDAPQANG
jgi:DNA-binding transcriptional ArsR family regulator